MRRTPDSVRRGLTILLLAAAGLAGNYFKLPLFYNIDFLFGGIVVMLTISLYGAVPGLLVGVISGSYTWLLWNHPYALVVFAAEAAFVAGLYKRQGNIVILDTLFWVFAGMPLIWIFYHQTLGLDNQATLLILLKQSINGVFNALAASILFKVFRHFRLAGPEQYDRSLSIRNILFNAFVGIVLFSTLMFWVVEVRTEEAQGDKEMKRRLLNTSNIAAHMLSEWLMEHREAVRTGDLDRLKGLFSALGKEPTVSITVLDRNRNIVISTDPRLKSMDVVGGREGGVLRPLEGGAYQWIPGQEKGKTLFDRWKKSLYVLEKPLPGDFSWTVVVEMAMGSRVTEMASDATRVLSIVWALVFAAIALSALLSRVMTRSLLQLRDAAASLPDKITGRQDVLWPESSIGEIANLVRSFKSMSELLAQKIEETVTINQALREEIEARKDTEYLVHFISEYEKRQLGQELHDGLGQLLAGMAYRSGALHQRLLERSAPEAGDAEVITGLTAQAASYTRDLARLLLPVELFRDGLPEALSRLCADAASRFGITCASSCSCVLPDLDYETASNLYRIAQEAVTNAVKHGEAGAVKLTLTKTGEGIVLSIQDNGSGLAQDWRTRGGLGLQIMGYRAKMIDARLEVTGLPSGGVEVVCVLRNQNKGRERDNDG